MIELCDVTYTYEDAPRPALSGISFTINRGEMIAVVGHNGSGKSTLAKHFNGLLAPTSGEVKVLGMSTSEEASLLSIRQHVGMVFQNPDNQLVTTIVEEDVAFGPECLGVPQQELRARVDMALDAVNMRAYANSAPHMLSGGQKQRVAIAGMLAMQPDVLVLDEATSMLDPEGRKEVWKVVKRLNKETGMTVVIITQLMEEATDCDRVAVLSQGQLMQLDTPRAIFRDAERLRSYGLDVPVLVRMRDALLHAHIPLEGEPLDVEALAEAIVRAKGGK